MLERLSVRGLGIIDAVELDFSEGFTSLTGETGAGKSLLVESLKLLAGQRAQSDLVRTGDDRLRVEGAFEAGGDRLRGLLDELGLPVDDQLILRREVTAAGRSRCWINDTAATAAALQRLAPYLLAIHGQHDQHGLGDGEVQRRMVDDFGDTSAMLAATREAFERWSVAAAEMDRLRAAQQNRRDRLDAIAFQVQEIDAVGPVEGEDNELRTRRLVVRHAARLAELSSSLIEGLSDGDGAVVDGLARARRELEEMAECGLDLSDGATRLAEAGTVVEEVVREVRSLVGEAAADPAELDGIESRLHALEQLMLKYGSTLGEVLEHRRGLLAERSELELVQDHLLQAEAAAHEALEAYDRCATELHEARVGVAGRLASEVQEILARLEMSGTRLEFSWRARRDPGSALLRDGEGAAFGADGVEECELLIAANPGEELRPMARIASGGELSRLHLALRTALRRRRPGGGLTL
ncbi:MAG: AAA family ATPase, partial [Holophagae bacterium]